MQTEEELDSLYGHRTAEYERQYGGIIAGQMTKEREEVYQNALMFLIDNSKLRMLAIEFYNYGCLKQANELLDKAKEYDLDEKVQMINGRAEIVIGSYSFASVNYCPAGLAPIDQNCPYKGGACEVHK